MEVSAILTRLPPLLQPTTASGTESTEAKYGLMSISGVPSRQSSPTTESVVPSTRTSRTTLMAIGFGRTGERSAKVPRRSPWRGACTSRSRRAWSMK